MARVDRFHFERTLWSQGHQAVAGVDEAGRGPLAGPVVAAAVILPSAWMTQGLPAKLRGLNDSKQLTEDRRNAYYAALVARPDIVFGISSQDAGEIDRINILQATHVAMNAALALLPYPPQHILVDGLEVRSLTYPQTALIGGDSRSYSIAAASVLAKVTRDRLMLDYDRSWPQYGFASHKGYPTERHLQALTLHGPCPIHRRTFSPVRAQQLEFL